MSAWRAAVSMAWAMTYTRGASWCTDYVILRMFVRLVRLDTRPDAR